MLQLVVAIFAICGSITFALITPVLANGISDLLFANRQSSDPTTFLNTTLYCFFLLFVVTGIFPLLLIAGWRSLKPAGDKPPTRLPFVSIIIPAFNEEKSIARCLNAVTGLNYPSYEVLVIDDGSTDFTMPIIERSAVRFIHCTVNRGKAEAVNDAVRQSRGEILVFSDSDSWLDPNALRHLVSPFGDPQVGMTAGNVIVPSSRSWLRTWQSIEYMLAQALAKPAQQNGGSSISVCPGVICAMRRTVYQQTGGFSDRTQAEDFDITLAVIRAGYRVCYQANAKAYTECPDNWPALIHQRKRWSRGTLQVLLANRDIIGNRSHGALSFFWLPHMLAIGYGGPIVELLILLILPIIAFTSTSPLAFFQTAVGYWIIVELIGLVQHLFAAISSRQLSINLLAPMIINQPYRLVLGYVRLMSIFRQWRGTAVQW